PPPEASLGFVVQKHWARSLHYDLRLEMDGRLVSWAVPKGPSRDPAARRLAIRMPDHPIDYGRFEGTIPSGAPGAGIVLVWDLGTYEALRPAGMSFPEWLDRGYLKIDLHGVKLHGLWELVRLPSGAARPESWLWVKIRDRFAHPAYDPDLEPLSAITGRTADEIGQADALRAPPPAQRPLEAWGRTCAEDPLDLPE
ncbi:MAG TPA: DNA polymerase ligase N-terminal domain-containing protein, partial [Thermoplasmata archaeon]|nr:DNA polymerase ligase N-terminal domain-containing protein [Thermoplasmata archaeon]